MGAELFTMTEAGTDVQKTFNALCDDALFQYGHDPYSGSIATTSLGHEINAPEKLQKAFKKSDWKIIDEYTDLLYSAKRYTNYIKTISHYEGFAPKWTSDKETIARTKGVKSIVRYSVIPESKLHQNNAWFRSYETLTDAKREAKEMALRECEKMIIKQHRSNGEMFKIGYIDLESDGKRYKTKRIAKTKVYLPVYNFQFFVYAAS